MTNFSSVSEIKETLIKKLCKKDIISLESTSPKILVNFKNNKTGKIAEINYFEIINKCKRSVNLGLKTSTLHINLKEVIDQVKLKIC